MAELNIAAFIREDAKTVGVRFHKDQYDRAKDPRGYNELDLSNTEYTYITNLDFKVGDLAVVYVMGNPKVVMITSLHDGIMIQPNADKKYNWIVAKVDTTGYEKNEAINDEIEATVQMAYQENVKNQFRNLILNGMDEVSRMKVLGLIGHKEVKPVRKSRAKKVEE